MKSEILTQGMTAADLDKLDLLADVQFFEPMGSAALNRKFYGIMPPGIYRGFQAVVRGGLKVSVGDSPVNVAAVDVDGFMITVQGRRPVELTIPVGRKVYGIIEANYAVGRKTTQVDINASIKAADIRIINPEEKRSNHVIIFSANLPDGTTEIRADQIDLTERQEADIGSDAIDRHTKNYLNPHQVNKGQIGLSDVENFGIATLEEAKAGEAEHKYMTPATTAAAITEQAGAAVSSHTGNKNNPHGVTKAQVGLGKVNDYAVATTAEAQAGTVTDKYMTPATTAAAITQQAGAAVSSHTGDKGNPHGVTKAQVGLGIVENYGIATTAEAQAGTVANKYMTPATTAAAITEQAGAAVSSHTGNKNNPHGVTKAQVGLGSVNDWGATSATNDASDTKYATASAVKKTYDFASGVNGSAVKKNGTSQGQDFNTLVSAGYYKIQNATPAPNQPAGYAYGMLEVVQVDGDSEARVLQIYYPHQAGGAPSFRTRNAGLWTAWGKIYTSAEKPTPADIGAAPASHNHAWGNITGVPVYATRWPSAAEAGAAPASHGHAWGDITGVPVFATRWPSAAEAGAVADGGTYGTIKLTNWIRTHGNTGWYNETHGGGMTMEDGTWVRVYGSKKLHVPNGEADSINTSGGVYAGGNGNFNDVLIRSDRCLKSNFEPITNALEKVSQLYGQIYDKAGVREAGLIAQDVQAVQPESVQENKEGMLTIAPAGVIALLVEAVKELRSENIALKARLDQMGA